MTDAELRIDIPIFNFDIVQGQDLAIPVEYIRENVADSMLDAVMRMNIVSLDWSSTIDTLTIENGRIVISGVNKANIIFPASVSSGYVFAHGKSELQLIHNTFLSSQVLGTKRIFEGRITVKRAA